MRTYIQKFELKASYKLHFSLPCVQSFVCLSQPFPLLQLYCHSLYSDSTATPSTPTLLPLPLLRLYCHSHYSDSTATPSTPTLLPLRLYSDSTNPSLYSDSTVAPSTPTLPSPPLLLPYSIVPLTLFPPSLSSCRVLLAQKQSYSVDSRVKSNTGMNRLWNMFSGVSSGSSESIQHHTPLC